MFWELQFVALAETLKHNKIHKEEAQGAKLKPTISML